MPPSYTERFNSDPRCAGLDGSSPGDAKTGEGVNGASPLLLCGVSRIPEVFEIPEVVDEAAGSENAVSEEPMIMASIINNIY